MSADSEAGHIDESTRRLLRLIDEIYGASVDPSRWRAVLERCVEAFAGFSGNLNYYENAELHSVDLSFAVLVGLDPAGLAEYRQHVLRDVRFPALTTQPWHPGAKAGVTRDQLVAFMHGTPFADRDVISEDTLHGSDIYKRVLQPHGIEHSLFAVDFEFDDAAFALGPRGWSLAVFRGPEGRAFGPDECARMSILVSHVRRAIDIHTALARLRGERDAAFAWLNQLPMGSLVLDEDGTVVFANAIARQMSGAAGAFDVRADRLHIRDSQARAQFIGQLGNPDATKALPIALGRKDGGPPLEARIVWLAGGAADGLAGRRRCAMFITRHDRRDAVRLGVLRAVFGFTEAEADVAEALARGLSPRQIAAGRGVSSEAIRFHLKNLYQKTGTHRQAALVRLIIESAFER